MLRSLYINLQEEVQVDMLMRSLPDLEYLNSLPVDRDVLNEEEDDQSEPAPVQTVEMNEAGDQASNPANGEESRYNPIQSADGRSRESLG